MKLKNKYPILLFLVALFFIYPCMGATERITNGNFTDTYSCSCSAGCTACIVGWDVSDSEYVCAHSSYNSPPYTALIFFGATETRWMSQEVDFTYADDLTFYGKAAYPDRYAYVYIDEILVDSILLNVGDFVQYTIDVSMYTGQKTLKFSSYYISGAYPYIYIDDVSCMTLNINGINYNPDIPVSNTKPFNLSYILNNTYAENPLYPCFIYSWVGTDIGNETHPNIIWQYNYEGYVNQALGSFTTSDYFHSYNWPDLNVSYGIVLYNPDGMTSGIRFDNIESDTNMLDYDQIYVHYNYSYPTPTPQPTPNMTAIPTPSGTPTPGPSATPQPDPESINESLNTSFKQGYSNLVNTTIDGFYEPVYNFTYYIVSPLLGINDTLYNFSIHMNESFTNSSSSLILSSSILFLIMTNIPDKLINVMTYYLIWLIVLLIFKGEA